MRANVMCWNMAGAKVFGNLDGPTAPVASTYIQHFQEVWKGGILPYLSTPPNPPELPDIVLLQECIGFVDHTPNPHSRWQTGKQILQGIFSGYECFFFPAFSSHTHPHPARWNRFRQGGGTGHYIPAEIEAQQGYGVCVREGGHLRSIWVDEARSSEESNPDRPTAHSQYDLCFGAIHTTTGLYLGSRDTEPRLVVLGRLKMPYRTADERYVNFLNVHLTTLRGEREGNIRLDRLGSTARLQQLDLILDNVISAYQEAKEHRIPRTSPSRKDDIWIIAGDFNAIPDSEELELVRRAGFVDGNPDKRLVDPRSTFPNQIGTKWSLSNLAAPPMVVDYIMCGLQSSAFPMNGVSMANSRRPYRPLFPTGSVFEPDHAVLFASFDIG